MKQQSGRWYLKTMVGVIEEACNVVTGKALRSLKIKDKGQAQNGRDLVTDADTASEELIRRRLRKAYPDHGFFGEETYQARQTIDPEQPTFIVDPIDGTTNFAGGIPNSAISLGLWYKNRPLAGVAYDIFHRRLFICAEDQAEVHMQHIAGPLSHARVSTRAHLYEALVGFDWPHKNEARTAMRPAIDRFLMEARNVRSLGSAVLNLCAVAYGGLDAFVNDELFDWDVAAALLIVEKAGGKVTDRNGQPWQLGCPHLVASNGLVHEEIIQVVKR